MSEAIDIVQEILRDREKGAARLVSEYRERLYAVAFALCDDAAEAEDLVFRTFEQVLDKIESCGDEDSFYAWMCSILRNFHRLSIRRPVNRGMTPVGGDDDIEKLTLPVASDGIVEAVDAGILRQSIERMPPKMREVLILHYFLDQPISQIARYLMLPMGTVLSRLHYARQALAVRLGAKLKKPAVAMIAAGLLLLGATAAVIVGVAERPGEHDQTPSSQQPSSNSQLENEKGENEMNIKQKAVTVLTVATLSAASLATAEERIWTGASSDRWSDSANWQVGVVPTEADTVLLPANATVRDISLEAQTPVLGGLTVEADGGSTVWKIKNAADGLRVEGRINVAENATLALGVPLNVDAIRPVIKSGGGSLTLGGDGATAGQITIEGGKIVADNTLTQLEFRFAETYNSAYVVALSEIQLTYGGKPIPDDSIDRSAVTASSNLNAENSVGNLFDGSADTFWKPQPGQTPASVYIRFRCPVKVDGYRFCTVDYSNRPITWTVHAARQCPEETVLVDSRENVSVVAVPAGNDHSKNWSSVFTFNQTTWIRMPFSHVTSFSLASAGVLEVGALTTANIGSITGSGSVQLGVGSVVAPTNLTGWSGSFVSVADRSANPPPRVLLDSTQGAAEQPVRRLDGAQGNIAVENATATPVSMLIDNTFGSDPAVYGRLSDGAGEMGLVKRGTNTVSLCMQDADYTGATRVEGGTLCVAGARFKTARYVRFKPHQYSGKDVYDYNWGMNEFQLLTIADGKWQVVPFPQGTDITSPRGFHASLTQANLIDGNTATRCLVKSYNDTDINKYPAVTFAMGEDVTFAGYRWYTPYGGGAADLNRVPTDWTLEVSNDGTNWEAVDSRNDPYSSVGETESQMRGPYALGGEFSEAAFSSLPDSLLYSADEHASRTSTLKSRYFRFAPYEIRNNATTYGTGWQIIEFSIFTNGVRVAWPHGAMASSVSAYTGSYAPGNAINNQMADSSSDRFLCSVLPNDLIIDAGEELAFDAYGFTYGTATSARQPVSWNLYVSEDGSTWHLADNRNDMRSQLNDAQYTECGPFNIAPQMRHLAAGGNTIGDASTVVVNDNAVLELNTDYEVMGPLSGSGRVSFVGHSCAETRIPSGASSSYSGTLSGTGTLVKGGEGSLSIGGEVNLNGALRVEKGTLQLNDATITQLGSLSLTGGRLEGSGTVASGAPLHVDFAGGAYLGTIKDIGTLTVSGSVVYAVPEGLSQPFAKTLFRYESIDETSAAALRNGVPERDVPASLNPIITVSPKSCRISYGQIGFKVTVR